ncbi:MAG: hypothetical protein WCG06_05145, partial [Candidatus Omnitrophota bacterium]
MTESLVRELLAINDSAAGESPSFHQQWMESAWRWETPYQRAVAEALASICRKYPNRPEVTAPFNQVMRNPQTFSGVDLPDGALLYRFHPLAALAANPAYATYQLPMTKAYYIHWWDSFKYFFGLIVVIAAGTIAWRHRRTILGRKVAEVIREERQQDRTPPPDIEWPGPQGARLATIRPLVRRLPVERESEASRKDWLALLEYRLEEWDQLLMDANHPRILDENDIQRHILDLYFQLLRKKEHRLDRMRKAANKIRRLLDKENMQMGRLTAKAGGPSKLDPWASALALRLQSQYLTAHYLSEITLLLRSGRSLTMAKNTYDDYERTWRPMRIFLSLEHLRRHSQQMIENVKTRIIGITSKMYRDDSPADTGRWFAEYAEEAAIKTDAEQNGIKRSEMGEVQRRWIIRKTWGRNLTFVIPLLTYLLQQIVFFGSGPAGLVGAVVPSMLLAGGVAWAFHSWALKGGLELEEAFQSQWSRELDEDKKEFEKSAGTDSLESLVSGRNLSRKFFQLWSQAATQALDEKSCDLVIVMPGADPAYTIHVRELLESSPMTGPDSGVLYVMIPDSFGWDGSYFAAVDFFSQILPGDTIEDFLARVLSSPEGYAANPHLQAWAGAPAKPGGIRASDIHAPAGHSMNLSAGSLLKDVYGGVLFCGGSEGQSG